MDNILNIFGPEAVLNGLPSSGVEELMLVTNHTEGWLSFSLLLLFFLCFHFIFRFFYSSKAELLHLHITIKHSEEHSLIAYYLRLPLMLLSAGILAFVLFVIIRDYVGLLIGLEGYLLILAALIAFYLLKTILLYIIGYLSETLPTLKIIIYYSQLHIITGSLLLFPLLMLLFNKEGLWSTVLMVVVITICVLTFLSYLLRCWQIFSAASIPVFFRILYLCTLEFVPFLIIYKYISLY